MNKKIMLGTMLISATPIVTVISCHKDTPAKESSLMVEFTNFFKVGLKNNILDQSYMTRVVKDLSEVFDSSKKISSADKTLYITTFSNHIKTKNDIHWYVDSAANNKLSKLINSMSTKLGKPELKWLLKPKSSSPGENFIDYVDVPH